MLLHTELSPAQRVPALITLVVTFCVGAGVLLAHAERQPSVMANATPDGAPAMLILGVNGTCPEGYSQLWPGSHSVTCARHGVM